MAYAVLFSLTQTIDQILKPDHFPISDRGKQQIESLRQLVNSLLVFVERHPNEAISFEMRITRAANEAEDILEHYMYEHIRRQHKLIRTAAVRKIKVEPATDLRDFRELKMATEEINSIAEASDVKRRIITDQVQLGYTFTAESLPSSSATLTFDDVTVGLEDDLKKIKDLLCDGSSELQIIPITGMGGIGKTTLARKAYNDDYVKHNFKIRAWITVSHNYKIDNIFFHLLESLKEVDPKIYNTKDAAQDKIYRILSGRKYLIVVDDLWSTNAWDDMKKFFPSEGKGEGSRVMITTREKAVASHAGSSASPHEMSFLDKNQSWILLKKKVFSDNECPSQLTEIGKRIAITCDGLPLAIVLVAGILSHVQPNPVSWEEIAKDVQSALDKESKGKFEERIALSYTHLPHYLRQCFLYMGSFPEDHEIRISKLMKMWVAEGFVKLKKPPTVEVDSKHMKMSVPEGFVKPEKPRSLEADSKHVKMLVPEGFVEPEKPPTIEEEAYKCLEDLVKRNLALVTSIKSNGKVKTCNVHDMVRDLCKTRALDENYERRLSFNHPDLTRVAKAYGSTLRSVISFQADKSSLGGLRKFRLLRLLDVVDTAAYFLPAPVFELFHLRYLAFGCPMEVPKAISRLKNLRTLVVRPTKRFRTYSMDEVYLPVEIWSLPLLGDLFSFFDLLPNPEGTASPLKELLTLSVVKKLICTKELMKMIPNVKKLGITYFGDKYKEEDYQLENLELLTHLEKLKLIVETVEADSPVKLKINPVFPKRLTKLTLSGWRRRWEDLDALAALRNLQVLKLRDHACEGGRWETSEEQFPCLEYLLIDTSDLKEWETDKSHLNALRRLVIYGCKLLSEIPARIGEINTLRLIEVDHANKDLVECVKRIHEEQKDEQDVDKVFRIDLVHYKGA